MHSPNTHDLSRVTHGHMSDADQLLDCLFTSKERAMLYAKSALEATNNGMREFFLAMHGEETHTHEVLFSFLHTRGFYPTEMASPERIAETRRRFQMAHDEMGLTDKPSGRRYRTTDPELPPAHLQNPEPYRYKEQQ